MKVQELLKRPSKASLRDRELLLAHLLKVKVGEVYLLLDRHVSKEVEEKYMRSLSLLEEGYPLQYLLGEWDFYGRTFRVKEGVLIPRPETELLVEKVLEKLPPDKKAVGFEIGVGTGCISITLLLERPKLIMYADDLQEKAVHLAETNARLHKVEDRLFLRVGDMFEPVKGMVFDFVVSNPPYIPQKEWEGLPKGVKLEGKVSLIGGEKGYEFYERFAKEVGKFLKEDGFFALEIGHDQGKILEEIFSQEGFSAQIFKDYAGQDRVVLGWKR
ncbi:MAG: peptide chain release factor N(5)-glutamine methyltransferase [Hydrogenobacter thermophilus]|uniref:peptide chain release factor N(5)-glutamine methyltransferase n=1 Tax=Hydrogenobacter thermophilus TaxID=940 RepID=UPI001C788059|nr:peptide chain release factor N(5)-glutamine methyltransferase [Hydrogenobacter thermophilus]QWK20003.1 MAG: peptide chain release factor N(5)-glutamine methyltransferase [Hydrogenobacter thermophilus]